MWHVPADIKSLNSAVPFTHYSFLIVQTCANAKPHCKLRMLSPYYAVYICSLSCSIHERERKLNEFHILELTNQSFKHHLQTHLEIADFNNAFAKSCKLALILFIMYMTSSVRLWYIEKIKTRGWGPLQIDHFFISYWTQTCQWKRLTEKIQPNRMLITLNSIMRHT